MKTILVRSDSQGVFEDERILQVWESIKKNMPFINPEVWISEVRDHKGTLMVTWEVKPTKELTKTINRIWEIEFFENQTEHIYDGRRIN
jgi:hypothetical protein